MTETVLVINAGSSSVKFSVYDGAHQDPGLIFKGQIEGIGSAPRFSARDADGLKLTEEEWPPAPAGEGHARALRQLGDWLDKNMDGYEIIAAGHRVVLGGPDLTAPVLIDEAVMNKLESLVPLVPLHQPNNLAAIRAIKSVRPDLPQMACFDTAFHRGHPRVADRYALPDEYYQSGVVRYGFHGLSYEYIAMSLREVAPDIANGRIVVAHLGSGASMCAIRGGKSIDTTMGFSALDGLPMGTRCGSLDPGVMLYLLQQKGMDGKTLENLLYKQSGLRGISGISNDLRILLDSDDPRAAEAIDYFVYHIGRELGSLTATLGGLDALVFTAGIGENAPLIRERVCRDAAWLGIKLDASANEQAAQCISAAGESPSVWVIPTDEERMIAMHTLNRVAARGVNTAADSAATLSGTQARKQ